MEFNEVPQNLIKVNNDNKIIFGIVNFRQKCFYSAMLHNLQIVEYLHFSSFRKISFRQTL